MVPDSAAPPARAADRSSPVVESSRWLWLIVAVAAVLRLFPIWFGLPYLHARPDEGAAIGHAMAMLEGDLNPHFFHWPSLIFYVFAILFWVASAVRGLFAADGSLTSAEQILVGRAFVALAGTLTVVVAFRLARRTADTSTGLLAAGFLAVALLHVRDSHFAMTDVVMTLLVTTSLALVLRALDKAMTAPAIGAIPLGGFALAGLAGGLAASTKYSAAAVVVSMAAAHVLMLARFRQMPWNPRTWLPSVAFLAGVAGGFLAATPYAVLDFEKFSADLRFDFTHLSGGHGLNLGRGWIYHLTHSLPYGAGVLTFLAASVGVVPLVRQYPRHAFVIGSFAAAFYASIGSGYTVFFRYVLPLIPIACLSAAIAVRHAGPWIARRGGVSTGAAILVLGSLVAAPSLVHSIWFDVVLARKDTRVLAAEWLAPRIRTGETLYDSGGDYGMLDLGRRGHHVWRFDPSTGSFGHPEGHTPDWLVLHRSPVRTYANHAPGLRRLAHERYDLVWEVRATRGAAGAAVYDLQDAFFMPLSDFDTVARPGPTIRIYRFRKGDSHIWSPRGGQM
ncbi:MAG: glycosyltransferase family 39 protein [Vicinamibacterales bacterium]